MSVWEIIAIFLAGMAAGTINTIVGSGSLISFPTLLAFGYPAVGANISNNIGMVFGGVSGTLGYRAELAGQGSHIRVLVPASVLGSVTGALLLLRLPAAAFKAIVPVLIVVALVLVIAQPRMQPALARRRERAQAESGSESRGHSAVTVVGIYASGVYGGYFGAAQGVLLVGLLGSLLPESLQRVNALKNLLALTANSVAAVVFMLVAWDRIYWGAVLLLAVGATLGGVIGARVGRRLPPAILRAVIVVVGLAAIVRLLA
ncbi:MAG: sulfite exporter TauE/SafE family protein [Actinomycetota bacterium]|nr:sulfite exporter TauE/SafE family protein [Actinomycetota bacterium]